MEDTTSATTGSLVVNGGVGIKGKLYVGGSSIMLNSQQQSVICPDTQVSMDKSRLSLCGGGDNSTKRGGMIQLIGNNNSEKSGSVLINAGSAMHGSIYFSTGRWTDDASSNCIVNHVGEWHIFTTSESSNTKTGALVIDGGVGIGKKLVATDIKCLNMLQLALFSGEPDCGEIGSLYYDTTRDCVRVFTKHGWRNMAFK
jgi:hypothetical protein